VIMAAGRAGPGTAASLRLLAADDFREHPLGGVFRVNISTSAPWERRYESLRPVWETHPYSFEDYPKHLGRLREKTDTTNPPLTKREIDTVRQLLDMLKAKDPGGKQLQREPSVDGPVD